MDIELNQNLARIIRTLEGQGMKPTKIAHAIGYAATRQLDNSIEGKSMLSIKAVRGLISNLNVNPIYLFLGKGEMFLADETEVETLRRENQELIHKHSEVVKAAFSLYEINKKLEKRNADLIDLSSAALKYNQGRKQEEQTKEEKDPKDPVTENLNFLRWMDINKKLEESGISYPMDSNVVQKYLEGLENEIKVLTKEEPQLSVKQDKK
jgi:hypothetical protein